MLSWINSSNIQNLAGHVHFGKWLNFPLKFIISLNLGLENGPHWIGGTRLGNRVNWVWFTFKNFKDRSITPVRKFYWAPGEPVDGRDCMSYDVDSKEWTSERCTYELHGLCQFKCKWKHVPDSGFLMSLVYEKWLTGKMPLKPVPFQLLKQLLTIRFRIEQISFHD